MSFIARLFSPTPQFEYTKVEILRREIIRIKAEITALQRSVNSVYSRIEKYENIPDRDRIQEYQDLKAKRNGYEERLQKANEEINKFEEQLDEANREIEHEQIEGNQERKYWLEGRKNGSWAGGKSKKRKNKKNTKTKTKKNKSRQRLKKRRWHS